MEHNMSPGFVPFLPAHCMHRPAHMKASRPQNEYFSPQTHNSGQFFPQRGPAANSCRRGRGRGNYNRGSGQSFDDTDSSSNAFSCETCNRGFNTEAQYKEHCSQHVKCPVEGCNVVGHPKIIMAHHDAQHKTGLANRIGSLNTKEAIEKWRQERRKNYPTKENVEKKLAVTSAREARGEVIQDKYFGKMRGGRGRGLGGRGRGGYSDRGRGGSHRGQGRGGHGDRGRGRGRGRGDRGHRGRSRGQQSGTWAPPPVSIVRSKRRPDQTDPLNFGGDKSEGELTDSEDEAEHASSSQLPVTDSSTRHASPSSSTPGHAPVRDGGLAALAAYSSSENEQEAAPAEEKSVRPQEHPARRKRPRLIDNPFAFNRKARQKPLMSNRRISLLQKILASDIRHERNVLLQCVRYIVRNGFFGIGPAGNAESTLRERKERKKQNFRDTLREVEEGEAEEEEDTGMIDDSVW